MLRNDIDTEQHASRQHEMTHSFPLRQPVLRSGGGHRGGAMYPNPMMPGYGGLGRTHASAGEKQPRMAQGESARHAHDDSQLRGFSAARNGLDGVYALERLVQHDGC